MTAVHKTEGAATTAVADAHDGDPWVSLNTAAEIRGKARNTVLLEALDGKIRHQKVAGRRFFHRDDLETLRNTQGESDDEE